MGFAGGGSDAAAALLARMTLSEKIGQLNLLAAGEGLATGAGGPSPVSARLDAGQVGAVYGTKSLASARDDAGARAGRLAPADSRCFSPRT